MQIMHILQFLVFRLFLAIAYLMHNYFTVINHRHLIIVPRNLGISHNLY